LFVAAGTLDFGKAGALSVAQSLQALQAPLELKLYEAEHLLVVPDALPAIFAWMDRIVGRE
jgi:hypothetical protein